MCKKGQTLDEACFMKTPLDFEEGSTLKWDDGSTEEIAAMDVFDIPGQPTVKPPGSMWRMNPLPVNPTEFHDPRYDFAPPCKAGAQPPVRAPMAVGEYGHNPGPCAGNWPTTVTILDKVRVPADIEPGEYVLSWRWDCELTAQVWNACSDVTIVKA